MALRTLIVDNKSSIRRRVKEFLAAEPGISVVGEAGDGQEAVRKAREIRPDVVIMDVGMPGINGLAATQQITSEMPGLKVIMLTVYDLPEYAEAAMASGASGYVIKTSLFDDLMPAIERAMGGFAGSTPSGVQGPHAAGSVSLDDAQEQHAGLAGDVFEDMVIQTKVKIMRRAASNAIVRGTSETAGV
jgi:DNA-binding NarL/FixJ family response regulator